MQPTKVPVRILKVTDKDGFPVFLVRDNTETRIMRSNARDLKLRSEQELASTIESTRRDGDYSRISAAMLEATANTREEELKSANAKWEEYKKLSEKDKASLDYTMEEITYTLAPLTLRQRNAIIEACTEVDPQSHIRSIDNGKYNLESFKASVHDDKDKPLSDEELNALEEPVEIILRGRMDALRNPNATSLLPFTITGATQT